MRLESEDPMEGLRENPSDRVVLSLAVFIIIIGLLVFFVFLPLKALL